LARARAPAPQRGLPFPSLHAMPAASGHLVSALACALLVSQVPGRRVHLTPAMAPATRPDGPLAALEASMDKLNATMSQIINGEGTVGKLSFGKVNVKKCITLCPALWSVASWRMSSMKKAALDVVAAAAGTRPSLDIEDLQKVHPRAAIRYKETMRTVVYTFLEAVDASTFQRVLITLFSKAGFVGEKSTGLTGKSFCFFQEAWEELKVKGTEPSATEFWSGLFADCPPIGQALPAPFENEKKAEQLAGSLALAFAGETPEVLEQQRQLFESAPEYVGCVWRPSTVRHWSPWELTVKEGRLMWRRSKECGSNVLVRNLDASTRTASIAYLTAKVGEDVVQFSETDAPGDSGGGHDPSRCIKMSNPWRDLVFCTGDGTSMEPAKHAIEGQLEIIGPETRAAIATSVELQRLIFDSGGQELKEEFTDLDKGGQNPKVESGSELLTDEEDSNEEVAAEDLQRIAGELSSFADNLNVAGQQTQVGMSEDREVASRVIQTVSSGRLPAPSAASLVQEASARADAGRVRARGQFISIILATASSGATLNALLNIVTACQGRNCLGME